ncbi:hypothetical protein POTOM_034915 [Populus tomentosa]|uniref:Uncharacterized protein n=1 Tax=Populus tomentosa TaxID=118781 RepID=A0A8X7Z3E9_POPTO|nr:hypothetical protein POTOM_034915 [Populus tomentosa]
MAKEREVMKIEKNIRLAQIILFWIERAAILLFVFFGGIPRFLRCSLGLFAFTNIYHASLAYERLFGTLQPSEPSNAFFVFDRYAIWLAAMYFFLGSPVYRYVATAVFVLSNTSSIVKALGVMNANQILCCNPTDCDGGNILSKLVEWYKSFKNLDCLEKDNKEEEIEKALAVEESAEEKTKHGEIEEIPETETIEPEAHHEVDEEDYEMVSHKIKDVDEEEEEDCSGGGGDEEEEEDCSSSVGDDDDDDEEEEEEEEEEDCSSSVGDDDEEEEEEEEYCYSSDDDGDVQKGTIEKEVMKDQELKETGDGRCCETSRALSSMQREIGLLKELSEKNCKLMKDLADTLLLLEQENEVLSRKLISAESRSSTELLNQIVYEYERKCQRLEEEKADLNDNLSTAEAESDFYRECMHNLGLN